MGVQGQVIIDVIPELEQITGKQTPVPELSGTAAQNRFNLLFQKFISVFTTKDHPLTLFLDDLQWADSASLNLMKILMGDSQTKYLLLLGAYRDNEVFPAHPLMLTLGELEKQQTTISTITLAPLSVDYINELVAETLSCSLNLAAPLTDLIYQKTQGNPFFTTQFLKGLHEDRLIAFNPNMGYWECDLVQVRDAALTDDVVEFMAGRLYKLPETTQKVMKLAACIGNQFDLDTLAIIYETPSEEVARVLWNALREGFILPQSEAYKFFQGWEKGEDNADGVRVGYRFLHDRVQQAAYSLIPEEQRKIVHVQIGQLLLANTSSEKLSECIFKIVNHLNKGIDNLKNPEKRAELFRLNSMAGFKAKETTAYESASNYFEIAQQLLPPESWQQCYEVTLEVYLNLTEVNYLSGKFARSIALVELTVESAKHGYDRAEAFNLAVLQFTLQGKFFEALEYGRKALECLKFELSEMNVKEKIESCQAKIDLKLANKKIEELVSEPEATVPDKRAIIKILNNLLVPTYVLQKEDLYFLITLSIVLISLEFGMVAESGYGFSSYGMYLGGREGNYQLGYEFGRLAKKLAKRFRQGRDVCKACYILGNNILSWVRHLRESESIFNEGFVAGLESGELIFSANILMYKSLNPFYMGDNIPEIQQTLPQHLEFAVRTLNYQLTVDVIVGLKIWLADLTQTSFDDLPSEQEYLEQCNANNSTYAICHYWILKAKILCLYGRYEEAMKAAGDAEKIINVILGKYQVAALNFYQSIAALEYCRFYSMASDNNYFKKAKLNQVKLGQWAASCPENFAHKHCLVDAVVADLSGHKVECIDLYDRAIALAQENKYIQEEALANELFAKFYLDWGRKKEAAIYMQEAYYCYAQWGAKVKDLETRYSYLLTPIFHGQQQGSLIMTNLTTMTRGTMSKTMTGIGDMLDLATLMQASRTLSENMELEGAIANLMEITRKNAGAQTIALMLFAEEVLMLVAKVTADKLSIINPLPVETSNAVPLRIINQVKRKQEFLVLENANKETVWAGDVYIQSHQPLSILCLPLIDRGQLIGILYLENNQVSSAFTSDQVEMLNLLCSQAAISLQNAQLYDKEQQARNDLQQALTDLQQAQLQLVQSEKMATLGNLVAGVAHEINNPVGFIGGNIEPAQEYLQDLLSILSLYEENASLPESIAEQIEDLDSDFIREDFPKLIASMKDGCDIIRNISKSLRTFSRTDTENKTEFNLHDGIDSTLLILKYRLKGNQERLDIEIVKNYGDIPEVKCYPGQLNQVFMNLLANAIDALDQSNEGKSFPEIVKEPNCITITTELSQDKQSVLVTIADNGKGMPEEVKTRIFEQGFTTKAVGKGTGLGMAIAHQIVTEKHGGKISCDSEVGKGTIFTIMIPR